MRKNKHQEELISGIVVDCWVLDLLEAPEDNSPAVAHASMLEEVMVERVTGHNEWIKVYTAAGASGFCKVDYVAIGE